MFVIDISGKDDNDPMKTILVLLEEIRQYEPTLLKGRKAIIFGNKIDLLLDLDSDESLVVSKKQLQQLEQFQQLQSIADKLEVDLIIGRYGIVSIVYVLNIDLIKRSSLE